jgi:hypothetical protein
MKSAEEYLSIKSESIIGSIYTLFFAISSASVLFLPDSKASAAPHNNTLPIAWHSAL